VNIQLDISQLDAAEHLPLEYARHAGQVLHFDKILQILGKCRGNAVSDCLQKRKDLALVVFAGVKILGYLALELLPVLVCGNIAYAIRRRDDAIAIGELVVYSIKEEQTRAIDHRRGEFDLEHLQVIIRSGDHVVRALHVAFRVIQGDLQRRGFINTMIASWLFDWGIHTMLFIDANVSWYSRIILVRAVHQSGFSVESIINNVPDRRELNGAFDTPTAYHHSGTRSPSEQKVPDAMNFSPFYD